MTERARHALSRIRRGESLCSKPRSVAGTDSTTTLDLVVKADIYSAEGGTALPGSRMQELGRDHRPGARD